MTFAQMKQAARARIEANQPPAKGATLYRDSSYLLHCRIFACVVPQQLPAVGTRVSLSNGTGTRKWPENENLRGGAKRSLRRLRYPGSLLVCSADFSPEFSVRKRMNVGIATQDGFGLVQRAAFFMQL